MGTRDDPYGLLILCEVATGDSYQVKKAEYMDKPPKFYHSTKACGQLIPTEEIQLDGSSAMLPMGPLLDQGPRDSTLKYDETVVYDVGQVCMRYLVKVKFDFKSSF